MLGLMLLLLAPSVNSFLVAPSRAFGRPNVRPLDVSVERNTDLFVDTTTSSSKHSKVSEYYGKTLQTSDDLATNACCTAGAPPDYIQACLDMIHPTTKAKYYGCGLCLPDELDGATILDLGCGAGRDVYIASQLVGPSGRVIGVDMTPEQLQIAKEYQHYHAEQFGFANTEFHLGYIEQLDAIHELEDQSIDVIVSNCVINLCPDKEAVLKSCRRLLKHGGELYFSDVYANRRVPQHLRDDDVLWGECLSGALYWNDFLNLAKSCGFADPRLVEDSPITISNPTVQDKLDSTGNGQLKFYSATYRLFALDNLESHCEDYGQAVRYRGTLPRCETSWTLDSHHTMETGRVFPVCGNTYNMLKESRFATHFDFMGDFTTHHGLFGGCFADGNKIPFQSAMSPNGQSNNSCC